MSHYRKADSHGQQGNVVNTRPQRNRLPENVPLLNVAAVVEAWQHSSTTTLNNLKAAKGKQTMFTYQCIPHWQIQPRHGQDWRHEGLAASVSRISQSQSCIQDNWNQNFMVEGDQDIQKIPIIPGTVPSIIWDILCEAVQFIWRDALHRQISHRWNGFLVHLPLGDLRLLGGDKVPWAMLGNDLST